MKKIFLLFAMIISFSRSKAFACDICGCGVNNYYIGMLPQFDHRFVGIRYNYSHFMTRMADDPSQFSKDYYQTVEAWAGWNIGNKLQVLALVPYNINHQVSDDGVLGRKGVGDVMLLANYKLIDIRPDKEERKMISQQLWIGGGVKFATGKFEMEENDPDVAAIANGQLGSGSTDFLVNASYNLHVGKWGINTNANYKINTINKDQFRFGNKFSANSFAYYSLNAGVVGINPNVGVLFEHNEGNQMRGSKVELTGGYLLQGSLGAEVNINKVAIGLNTQLPFAQNFGENQTRARLKGMAHVSFAF